MEKEEQPDDLDAKPESGDSPGLFQDPHKVIEDCQLAERYPTAATGRKNAMQQLENMANGFMMIDGKKVLLKAPRYVHQAIRTYGALDKLNMEQEKRHAEADKEAQGNNEDDLMKHSAEQAQEMLFTIRKPKDVDNESS